MTWTDDKEAEHQRIRADFAEAERERLLEELGKALARGLELAGKLETAEAEVEQLRAALERIVSVMTALGPWTSGKFGDQPLGQEVFAIARAALAEEVR